MGTGASVPNSSSDSKPEVVTKEQAHELAHDLRYYDDLRVFIDSLFDAAVTETLPKEQVLDKLEKQHQQRAKLKKEAKEARRRKVLKENGVRTWQKALGAPGVDELSALPEAFRTAVVPRDSEEVCVCPPRAALCFHWCCRMLRCCGACCCFDSSCRSVARHPSPFPAPTPSRAPS